MMKKTYKSSLLALSVLASFTSCSESESLQQANLSKDKITFHATLDNSWKPMSPASSSRAAIAAATEKGPIVVPTPFGKPLYLHSVVQETADLQQAAATTRGAMQEGTTLGNTYYNNSFGVTAIYKDNGTNTALFTNQGQIDQFPTPEITQYKLECWGAASWGTTYGGGYSYGYYEAKEKNKVLYVCAGAEGARGGTYSTNSWYSGGKGGYNGGGNGGNGCSNTGQSLPTGGGGNGGGGATHIAFKTGLLKVFKDTYKDDVLLVAGGQGGGYLYNTEPKHSWGGGVQGAGVYAYVFGENMGGGPVSEGDYLNGTKFGEGMNGPSFKYPYSRGSEGNGGGGGGLSGGRAFQGYNTNSDCDGGGGCGYVNKTHLLNPETIAGNQNFLSPSRVTENGHKGGGAAQISWLPSQLTRVK